MKITQLKREHKGKEGIWISFDFKRDLYDVISERLFQQACDLSRDNIEIIPILNDEGKVVELKEWKELLK